MHEITISYLANHGFDPDKMDSNFTAGMDMVFSHVGTILSSVSFDDAKNILREKVQMYSTELMKMQNTSVVNFYIGCVHALDHLIHGTTPVMLETMNHYRIRNNA